MADSKGKGGATVSNQKLHIATKKTYHIPRITLPDYCRLPSNVPAPFNNWVSMMKLQNATVITKIDQAPIWVKTAQVGPDSEPHHAGVNKGIFSHTYCAEAVATSYSNDVRAEGAEVVRSNDTTFQNHGNTVGIVDGTQMGDALPAGVGYTSMHCVLSELEGESETEGEEGKKKVKRPLGFPGTGHTSAEERKKSGEEPYYLEILQGDSVDFKATRIDATHEPEWKEPDCVISKRAHTSWHWARTGGNKDPKQYDGKPGPKFSLTKLDTTTVIGGAAGLTTHEAAPAEHGESTSGGGVSSFLAFINYWEQRNNPLKWEVVAGACAGVKKATIVSFPAPGLKIDINWDKSEDPYVVKIRSGFEKLKTVMKYMQKIAELAGKEFKVDMFVGVSLGGELAYQPIREDKKGFYGTDYTPSLVGRKWKLKFGADPLLKVDAAWTFSLLNAILPLAGEAAAACLRRLGIEADLTFGVEIALAVNFIVGQDEYDYWSDTGQESTLTIKPYLTLTVGAGIKLISLTVAWELKGKLKFAGGDKKGVLLQLTMGITGSLSITFIGLEDTWFEHKFDPYKPDWGQATFADQKYDIITQS